MSNVYTFTLDQLDKLTDCINKMDGYSSLSERNRSANQAHTIIEKAMANDAYLLYNNSDNPLEQFQIEQQRKSEDVIHFAIDPAEPKVKDQRKPQGGVIQRIKDELVAFGERMGWV